MFNNPLETARFPDSWKTAKVTSMFKDCEKDEKSRYRPMCIPPVISKVLKRTVVNELYEYIKRSSLQCQRQSGFSKFFFTICCLFVTVDDSYNGIDTGNYIGSLSIDLKQAFDTVDHRISFLKLINDASKAEK